MTTQVTVEASVEQRLASVEARLSALEATMTLFISEQREWRQEFVNEQRQWRREFLTEQREWRHEVNDRFERIENRIEKMDANIGKLYFATFSIVGALAVAVIAATILS